MKRLCALGVSLLALALAGNAAANDGAGSGNQTAVGSVGTVQVGSINASPSTAVNAPVNANAPVSVASETGDSSAQQESGGAQASSTSSGGSAAAASPPQARSGSAHQNGDTETHPASSLRRQTSSSCECKDNSKDNFVWGDSGQRGMLSKGGSSKAEQESGGAQASTAAECGEATGSQAAIHSIGTVQVGSVGVAPATAVNAPINVNAPVAVLSGGGCDQSAAQKGGGATALARPLV